MNSERRQVYRLKAGNMNRLRISEELIPTCQPNEVLIEVRTIGLNFADVFAILGLYSATPKDDFIPGLEYAGIVVAKGVNVNSVEIGESIMGVTRFGAYSSHIVIDHRYVLPLPQYWTFQEGASYLVQVLTAYYGLSELGNLKNNHTVLIHSAAGGVGIWANRICKAMGAFTIGTVGKKEKLQLLEEEGYDVGIVRDIASFKEDVLSRLDGGSLDLIMECIGGKIMKDGFDLLGPMGRQIVYGSAHYGATSSRPNYFKLIPKYLTRPKIDPQNMIKQNKGVLAFNLIYLFENVEIMNALLKELSELCLGKPVIGHSFTFEELPQAIRLFQGGTTMGKVVVTTS